MAKGAQFTPNSAGLREYLLSGDLHPALLEAAVPIYARAKGLAAAHVRTGNYERGIQAPAKERSPDRVVVRVRATDPKSALVEARYHVMGRAIG